MLAPFLFGMQRPGLGPAMLKARQQNAQTISEPPMKPAPGKKQGMASAQKHPLPFQTHPATIPASNTELSLLGF